MNPFRLFSQKLIAIKDSTDEFVDWFAVTIVVAAAAVVVIVAFVHVVVAVIATVGFRKWLPIYKKWFPKWFKNG